MYVVAGVTGNTGRAAAEALLAQGKPLTVIVRSPEKGSSWQERGAKVEVGSLSDSSWMTRVLSGADGAYLLVPPHVEATDFLAAARKVSDSLAAAVKASAIPHVALLSSVGAHLNQGTGPIMTTHYSEDVIGAAAANITIVRASYFLENWASVLPAVQEHATLPTFLIANREIPMVATQDIGAVVAESLLQPAQGRRIIELAGPDDYSPNDLAAALSELLNKPVNVQQVPMEAMVDTLTGMGIPKPVAQLYEEMIDGLNRNYVAFEGNDIRRGHVTPKDLFKMLLGL